MALAAGGTTEEAQPAPAVHRPWFPHGQEAGRRPCDAPCAREARPFVLAATILGSAMAFIDGTVVNIALPAMQRALGADIATLQWVVNAYALMLGALILTGGALGDRFGRRRVFVIGITAFAVASAPCGLAPDVSWLVAARAVQGVGAALLVPQSLAIIAASFPAATRGRAIGVGAGFAAITTAPGPVLGGVFIDLLSWRAVFWINLPLAAATVWLALRYIPESRDRSAIGTPVDWAGSLLVACGLGCLVYALTAAPERGGTDAVVVTAAAAGVVMLALFIRLEARLKAPIMPPGIFRSGPFSAANGVTLFLYFALTAVLFLLPFNLIQIHGYTALEAGLALLPFGVLLGLFSSRAGALADRYGPRWPLVTGSVLVALACIGLVLADRYAPQGYWTSVFPPILLLSVGMTINVAPLTTAVMNAVPDNASGTASGINNAASRLAGVLAVAVVGTVAAVVFAGDLATALERLAIDDAAREQLMNRAHELAALTPPQGLDQATARAVASAIDEAFRSGYHAALTVAALSAALAAGIAAGFLPNAGQQASAGESEAGRV